MKKQLIATIVAAMLSASAMAGNEILVNEYIKAGVNETSGTLGSGGNTSPGLLYDSTGTGTFNTSYDYLTPGTPFEGFSVKGLNSSNTVLFSTSNNNASYMSTSPITGTWLGTPTASSAVWESTSNSNFNLRNTYSLPSGIQYIDISTRIEAKVAIDHLYFARFIDPDARAATGDSSSTDNVRGYGIIPKTNVVFSEALASRYALGLYSVAPTGVNTSISPTWSREAKDYYTNTSGHDVVRGDYTIGISFYSAGLAVGDVVTYQYAYIFGPSAFGAASTAISGGAGGGTAGTSSFGTLVDVGSATSAASTSTTPTVTSTSTATITVSDTTAASVTLPVITASLAHHTPSETASTQTIARQTTTNVTTPMERTLVTKVRTTTNYSDGTSTSSDSANTTAVTISNSVATSVADESFSGRIDQQNQLSDLNMGINQSLNMNPFRMDVYKTDEGNFFLRGGGLQTAMGNGYSARSDLVNVGGDKQIDPNWRLGAQYSRVNTKMPGSDSYTSQSKEAVGVYSIYTTDDDVIISTNAGFAKNNINSNRTVENVFNNSSTTKGTDMWISNRVYAPTIKEETNADVRPFIGYTVGRTARDGYTEAGDIQSARTVAGVNNNFSFGEAGIRVSKDIDQVKLTGEASATTNGFTNTEAGIAYSPEKNQSIGVYANRQTKDSQATNSWFIRGIMRF
jgi:hypothetical protein